MIPSGATKRLVAPARATWPKTLLLVCAAVHVAAAQTDAALKKTADETLGLTNNVEASRQVDTVFLYSDALAAAGKRKDAIKYLRGGLKLSPFRVDQQLALAKLLKAEKDEKGAAAAAEIVARRAEDDAQIVEAKAILGQPMPETSPPEQAEAPKSGPGVVLVPLGECDVALVHELGRSLAAKIGIPVVVLKVDVTLPTPARDGYADLLVNMRAQMREAAKKGCKKVLERLKLKIEDLADDGKLLAFARACAGESGGPIELAAFDRDLRRARLARQWEAEKLGEALASAVASQRRPGLTFIGVTKHDMFMKNTNYVFGLSGAAGVFSYARFRGEFNDAPPDRKRLLNRALKQALSTTGFQFGVLRCTSPDCARAYPNSLEEHDAKGDDMCSTCKEALQKALAALK
jgi:predicted Zn-dependent protease